MILDEKDRNADLKENELQNTDTGEVAENLADPLMKEPWYIDYMKNCQKKLKLNLKDYNLPTPNLLTNNYKLI